MPLPSRIGQDACVLAVRWVVSPKLAEMLVNLERLANDRFTSPPIYWPGLYIISGYRTQETQARLNPNAPNSRHIQCPSMAVDLRLGNIEGLRDAPGMSEVWAILGGMWELMGGRWGGRFSTPDVNHFDLG